MSTTVVVAGAAGFIGGNLVRRLLYMGYKVIGVDDLSTGTAKNLPNCVGSKHFEFIKHNINVAFSVDGEVDWIFNLACPASPPVYQSMPLHTLKTCSQGVFNLLNLAKEKNARFLQASTSEIYGNPDQMPQLEDYWGKVNPVGPRSCYDEGKRFAESLVTNFANEKGVDVRIVRIFNTYGPGMRVDDGRVVSNFVTKALKNENLVVYGKGTQTRSFCFISDMVDALIKVMECRKPLLGPVNLGSDVPIKIFDLAKMIIRLCRSKSIVEFAPLPQDDPEMRCPSVEKAFSYFGWKAQTDLRKGMEVTIEYFKSELGMQNNTALIEKL